MDFLCGHCASIGCRSFFHLAGGLACEVGEHGWKNIENSYVYMMMCADD
jgi:hypothetical protein